MTWVSASATDLPAQWTGTITGSDPGFADLAADDLRPAEGSAAADAGNPSPQGVAGHLFPSPLAAPIYEPPVQQVEEVASPRPAVDIIDIGAFEMRGAS